MSKSTELYKQWTARQHSSVDTINIPNINMGREMWVKLGTLPDIAYRSDKWEDKAHLYLHEFAIEPLLLTNSTGRVLLVVGGNFKVTSKGIVG